MKYYTEPTTEAGDLYWEQLSMWDFSHKDHVDTYSSKGFHYELYVITEKVTNTSRRIRNVKVGELTEEYINTLIPEEGHNWNRVMGNNITLL